MRRKTRFIRWIPVILVAGGIAAFVLWPRPALELYTTPPLDSKGTRIQLLIPRGWRTDYLVASGPMEWDGPAVTSRPNVWAQWLPWFSEKHAALELRRVRVHVGPDYMLNEDTGYVYQLRDGGGKGLWDLSYHRSNNDEFRQTYQQILDSVKVL